MESTRTTLLERIKDHNNSRAWKEFYDLYSMLIYSYARTQGLNETNAEELVGDCMESLVKHMPDFTYDRRQCKFRSYIRRIVTNKIIDLYRKKRMEPLPEVDRIAGDAAAPDETWDRQWELTHLLYCWDRLAQTVPTGHAEAFRLAVLEEQPVNEVADKLGLSTDNVYQIKTRLTRRLRDMMQELLGESG